MVMDKEGESFYLKHELELYCLSLLKCDSHDCLSLISYDHCGGIRTLGS